MSTLNINDKMPSPGDPTKKMVTINFINQSLKEERVKSKDEEIKST